MAGGDGDDYKEQKEEEEEATDQKVVSAESDNRRGRRPVLVVGHFCHDRITLPGGSRVNALGGSVSYILNVFEALDMRAEIVSKVGPDFFYSGQLLSHLPHVVERQLTTEFFADFTSGEDRLLRVGNVCEPIYPRDILSGQTYELGLAVGIAGEVLPETIERMAQNSRIVIADVQALIRDINPMSGLVSLRRLEDTPYYRLLSRISFLKAARIEASFIDIEQVRQMTCVIVTEGENGSRVYSRDDEFRVLPFHATELDPTGAGDCFLAGFSAGLYEGLSVYQAVRMGNYFGALAVEQIGVPQFTDKQLEAQCCLVPVAYGPYQDYELKCRSGVMDPHTEGLCLLKGNQLVRLSPGVCHSFHILPVRFFHQNMLSNNLFSFDVH